MATRSAIGIEKDGQIFSAYCHYDGYLEGVGTTLYQSYQDPEKILKLITLGDMSELGAEVFPPEGVEHTYQRPAKNVTVYYNRDRGEDDCEFRTFSTRAEWMQHHWDCEFFYLWSNGRWLYSQGRAWADLDQAIEAIEADEAQ